MTAERRALLAAYDAATLAANALDAALSCTLRDSIGKAADIRRARQQAIWLMGHLDDVAAARASTTDTTAGDFSRQQGGG